MNSRKIVICSFIGLLVLGGLCAFYLHYKSRAITKKLSSEGTPARSVAVAGQLHTGDPVADVSRKQNTLMRHGHIDSKRAGGIFADENESFTSRFSTLMDMANSGDHDALHLALQIQRNCSMWSQLSADTYLPGIWKPEMGVALTSLQAKCAGLSQLPESQRLAEMAQNKPNDAFDQDVREEIRQAFADNGEDQAISRALDAYESRPDPTTAGIIAETLSDLDITSLDANFQIGGLNSSNPDYRRGIFSSALRLLACDYGVPCGPGSELVSSICANSGVCLSGYGLVQLYESVLFSGQDVQNINSVLVALRNIENTPHR